MIQLKEKVVPVATLNNQEETEELLFCLREGGLPVIEITYRTAYAREAIEYAVKNYPDVMTGAGTIINAAQCKDAIEAGAKFIVGPGFSEEVAACCKEADVLYIPGVVTPTEVMMAVNCGLTLVKFFPFSVFGGLAAVDALAGPFPSVEFMLTNGVTGENVKELLSHKKVKAVGGSWLIKGTKEEKIAKIRAVAEVK